MIEQIYQFKGLDLRRTNVVKDKATAQNLRNVELSSDRSLRKRYGFSSHLTPSETVIQTFENTRAQDNLYVFDDGIKKFTGGTEVDVNFGGDAWTSVTEPLSIAEYDGCNYFADPSGENELFKYDGYNLYRAGVPTVTVNSVTPSGSGSYYFRLAFYFIALS